MPFFTKVRCCLWLHPEEFIKVTNQNSNIQIEFVKKSLHLGTGPNDPKRSGGPAIAAAALRRKSNKLLLFFADSLTNLLTHSVLSWFIQ